MQVLVDSLVFFFLLTTFEMLEGDCQHVTVGVIYS